MSKLCAKCGAQLDESKKFCTNCGEKQEISAPPQQEQPVTQEPVTQPVQQEENLQPQPQYQSQAAVVAVQEPLPTPIVQPQARFCKNCGEKLDDDAKFCMVCGTKQETSAPQSQPQPQTIAPPQPQPPVQPVYQPVQQPIQGQPYGQAAVAVKPKKKSILPVILIILGIIILGVAAGAYFLVTSVFGILDKAAKEDYYKLGGDQIPSVKFVLGEERKLTKSSTDTSGDKTTKTIEYKASEESPKNDMRKYYEYLSEKENFVSLTEDINFEKSSGKCEMERKSEDDGYKIKLKMSYDADGYTITVIKEKGEISAEQPNDPTEPTEPFVPTESTEPVEPTEPTEPTDPTDEPDPIEDPNGPINTPGIENNTLITGVWRWAEDYLVIIYNFKADGKFTEEWYFTDGELFVSKTGKYSVSGDKILMTDIIDLSYGLTAVEDCLYDLEIYDDRMTVNDTEYDRIPAKDAAAVLSDPLYGLEYNDPIGVGEIGDLTSDIFSTIETGTYHIKMNAAVYDMDLVYQNEMEIEIHSKGDTRVTRRNVEGEIYRVITTADNYYAINDTDKTIWIGEYEPGDNLLAGVNDMSGLVYVGESSGDFQEVTYSYDEYSDEYGGKYIYYVDDGNLIGMHIISGGEIVEIEFIAFDQKIPSNVFKIPTDYEEVE